jgi:hypothetical protein
VVEWFDGWVLWYKKKEVFGNKQSVAGYQFPGKAGFRLQVPGYREYSLLKSLKLVT